MSSMTQCNWCSLQDMKKRRPNHKLIKQVGFMGGVDLFFVPVGEEPRLTDPDNDKSSHWAGWMAEIGSSCGC